jgi:hypothetical protein
MHHIRKTPRNEPITLIDRFALAFLSGLLALLTAGILWLALAGINQAGTHIMFLPVSAIWWFTGIMATLGFFSAENFLAKVLGKLWQFIRLLVIG